MGTPHDAALGLPLVMLGSDATDRLRELSREMDRVFEPHDGTKPGPTTPSRKDAASLDEHAKSVEGRRYAAKTGALMKNVMEARARMWGLLATEEEHAAFRAWEEATNLWIDHIIEGGAA